MSGSRKEPIPTSMKNGESSLCKKISDRIEYPETDFSCCCTICNLNQVDPNFLELINQNSYIIRSTLFEYLFRYNRNLYKELNKHTDTTLFQTCIFNEQYEQMEKDGREMYFKKT